MAFKTLPAVLVPAGPARVQLSSTSIVCNWVLIQVRRLNAAKIFVGDVEVLNDGERGITLEIPVAGLTLPYITLPGPGANSVNLNDVHIHGTEADGVNVFYEEQ